MRFAIRDVEELQVTVLVDNSAAGTGIVGTHGLSMLIRSKFKGHSTNVLFDVGPDDRLLFNNMEQLGIDPSCIDCMVLSHCHIDHAGGLIKAVERIGKKALPIFVHPAAFRISFAYRPAPLLISTLVTDKQAVEAAGGVFIPVSEPIEIVPGLFSSGTVPRETGEPTGVASTTVDDEGLWIDDPITDDLTLTARVAGKGLAVLTGCSHAGIVNILRHVTRMTGESRIALLMGGFHLMGADEKRIAWTIEEFRSFALGSIVSGHCTGFEAEAAMHQAFGKGYKHLYAGQTVRL